ncbi:uncharacterized protein LOC131038169 [Cryptomeria japonica]|uniref:uncharacterized protein LOC131038169 n=1 Tax=Cryptomeria japonica TaxID=3369 RepID=UPI0027D9ECCE|nr:uncharacterized protein LOC131038169 [Cryptomeria japonica]
MADLGGDEAEMARAMKRQLDEILKRLGVKREHLYCTDTSLSEPTSSGTSRTSTPKYSPPHMRNFEKNTTNEEGPWRNNGRWRNVHSEYYQNDVSNNENNRNHHDNNNTNIRDVNNRSDNNGYNWGGNNRGYNANYGGNYNNGNGNGNNNWNNGNNNNSNNSNGDGYNGNNNYNGGGNNGNHGNNGGNHNGRNINNQNNNSHHRPPMTIERYRQLDFTGIVGHPNHISNDLRNVIPKFTGNGTDTVEQHVMNV